MSATGTEGRQRRRPAQVRALILDAAALEFQEKGYPPTTITDIAARAGVTQAMFYRHFTSKADVFSEVTMVPLVEFLNRMQADFARYREEALDSEQLMRTFLTDLFTSLQDHREALAGLAGAWNELNDETTGTLTRAIDGMFGQLDMFAALEASRQRWYPSEGMDLVSRLLVTLIFGMITYDKLLLPGREQVLTTGELIDQTAKLVTWGLIRRDWRTDAG